MCVSVIVLLIDTDGQWPVRKRFEVKILRLMQNLISVWRPVHEKMIFFSVLKMKKYLSISSESSDCLCSFELHKKYF